jgi:plasmid stabilization system protein ParE
MPESPEYQVVLHTQARADLDDAYQNAARHAPDTASRWVDRFQEALATLGRNPQRCPLAPESRFVDEDIHEFQFRLASERLPRVLLINLSGKYNSEAS